jgi:hypothetical protein
VLAELEPEFEESFALPKARFAMVKTVPLFILLEMFQ